MTRSPLRNRRRADGMPWAASWLTLTHVAAGKPTVGGAGLAPWRASTSRPTASSSAVVTPGATAASIASRASATARPASRSPARSSSWSSVIAAHRTGSRRRVAGAGSRRQLVRRQRPQDAQLVVLGVGQHDPRDVVALPDVDAPSADRLEAGDLGGLVDGPQIEVQAVLRRLRPPGRRRKRRSGTTPSSADPAGGSSTLSSAASWRDAPTERLRPPPRLGGRVDGVDAEALDADRHRPIIAGRGRHRGACDDPGGGNTDGMPNDDPAKTARRPARRLHHRDADDDDRRRPQLPPADRRRGLRSTG